MNDALIDNSTDDVEEVETVETEEVQLSTDEIKKEHFESSQLAAAQDRLANVNEIASANGLDVVLNFDDSKEFPEGYGIAIIPIAKRVNGENKTLGVAFAAIPDYATVGNTQAGTDWIREAVYSAMIAKLANSVRPRGETGEVSASIPFSVEDFITSNRPEGVLQAYRNYAAAYVKVLKSKGLKFITESILRQTLQSAAFAEQQFPSIAQDKWVAIINSMKERATADKLPTGVLDEWIASRDSAELATGDVDLSDLDFDAI